MAARWIFTKRRSLSKSAAMPLKKHPTETWSNEGPQCPYCDRQFTADESFYYDEMNYTEETCDECGKKFEVRVCSTVAWACEPIEEDDETPETDNGGEALPSLPL